MFGLELPRPPASTKPMEVKLAHQESELVSLLKRIPLGPAEINLLRDRARQLRDGTVKSRGEALLPLMLATYTFDSLVSNNERYNVTDEALGFEAAVAAIGLKANISEAEHPLLCEGTRRQRGDLALSLLVHYKDQPEKVARIMDNLLDKEVHPLFKSPLVPSCYLTGSAASRRQQQQDLNQRLGNLDLQQGNQNQRLQPRNAFPRHQDVFDTPPPPLGVQGAAVAPAVAAAAGGASNWDTWESWEREREQQQAAAAAAGVPIGGGGRAIGGGVGAGRQNQLPPRKLQPVGGAALSRNRLGSDSGSSGNSSGDSIVSSSSSSRRNNSVVNQGPLMMGGRVGSGGNGLPSVGVGLVSHQAAGVPPHALVSDGLLDHPPPHQHDRPPPPLGGTAAANALSAAAMAGTGGMRHM
jgi:hypothetical protein